MENQINRLTEHELQHIANTLNEYELLPLPALQGFLTAVVSGPVDKTPDKWIEALNLSKIAFTSKNAMETFLNNIIRLCAEIGENLSNEEYHLISLKEMQGIIDDEDRLETAQHWAFGYFEAVKLDLDAWMTDETNQNDDLLTNLNVIVAVLMDEAELNERFPDYKESYGSITEFHHFLANSLPNIALNLFYFWLDNMGDLGDMEDMEAGG